MARAPLIRLALLAATLAVASACDILRPPARSLSSQLDYLPRTRENLQILARWWPLIAPDPQAAGLPTGQLPIALPVTFPSGISRAADLAGLAVPPAEVTCAVGCRATWLGRFHQTPFSGVAWIAPGGRLLGARFDVTSEAYGT